jgi:hypothetical protein
VPQGLLAERVKGQLESRRIVFRRLREVRPAKVRGAAYGREQVTHRGQVEHLLGGDLRDHALPPFDRLELLFGQPFARVGLEAEGSEEVFEHQHVLQLRGLREQEDELFPVLNNDRSFRQLSLLLLRAV